MWLPWQRWFASKGRAVSGVTVAQQSLIADHSLEEGPVGLLLVVRVDFVDGGEREYYQVPIGIRTAVPRELEPAVIAGLNGAILYDALSDHELVAALVRRVTDDAEQEPLPDATDSASVVSRMLGGEQSNSSVVVDERLLLKVFRRLRSGINPDVELQESLTRVGSLRVPRVLGSMTGHLQGEATTYAMLQEFLPAAADGWRMALASVRDLLANGWSPAAAGGDFASESWRLGVAVAEVHAQLVEALGHRSLTREDMRRLSAEMSAQFDRALRVVPALSRTEEATRSVFAAVAELPGGGTAQRIHGDLHLGQAVRTPDRWVLIDFEGEPAAPLQQRRALQSPLRDVAGMMRSFDYAAHHQFLQPEQNIHFGSTVEIQAKEWAQRNQRAFCEGYASVEGTDPREHTVLLRALTLHKAAYETVYEAYHRPSWSVIPQRAFRDLSMGSSLW
ncbi:maltokinase N-terminal cap-like domain-containing protein [Salinactinospora qingdaonensis]